MASSAITSHDSHLDIFKHYGFDSDVDVRMSSGLYEIITTGLSIKEFAYVPLVGVNKVRLTGTDLVLKMIVEYTLVIPSLIFLSPFFLLIASAIKIDSPGPVFHRRRVMGVNGKQFDAFKFRTMRVDGDEILENHPELKAELEKNHKLKDDPRITKLGYFLRRFSIDELPQLFNVLKMDMALVGPRMVSPEEMKNYNQWGMNLLTVRPGLTGLWQVSGRSDLSYKDRVRLDMYYVRNWSIWEDLQLIWRTIPIVIRGSGAY
jgi:lipopolysaccharide/colanic/teichoic acid biosynthesis glycosyltransferase